MMGRTYSTTWSIMARNDVPGSTAFFTQDVAHSGVPIVAGETKYAVARIDFDVGAFNSATGGLNDRIRLYLNPTAAFEPASADAELISRDLGVLNASGFWVQSATQRLDELRIGTEYSDMFGTAQLATTVIPEPSSFVLLGLGCLGLGAYGRRRRRRRPR